MVLPTMLPPAIAPTELFQQQRQFSQTGQTHSLEFRLSQLQRLQEAVLKHQDEVIAALGKDLGRPEIEACYELMILPEIKFVAKNLRRWAQPRRVPTSLDQFPASSWIHPEPKGVALVIGPWNYPFQLMLSPLIGAIAAGNCAVLKPSELAPATSHVIATLMTETFDPAYVAVVEGGVETSQQLLALPWDHIFFTGGTRIGKIVMAAAAQHLTPVTLELGGKSPCLVDRDVPLVSTAQRIIWGKFINAGQTCIAPDYVLVDRRIKDDLLKSMTQALRCFYGEDPAVSPDYCRIISQHHGQRLALLLQEGAGKTKGDIVVGGQVDLEHRYIAPTLVDNVTWDDPTMVDEIFGPILPILTYDTLEEAIAQVNQRPQPLALYLFSQNRQHQDRVLTATRSGGVCFNDTIFHGGNYHLPFGGVGESGLGNYHGRFSFETFSHHRSVLRKSLRFNPGWRFPPYAGKLGFLKKAFLG